MLTNRSPSLQLDQDSGAIWSVYDHPTDINGFTIVTSSGAELLEQQPDTIEELLRLYRAAEALGPMGVSGSAGNMRAELGSGQEAVVYAMGPYAVREQTGMTEFHTAVGQLQRMDAINDVMEVGLPRWLRLPVHYGLRVDPAHQKTYIMMDKINSGITLEDIMAYPKLPQSRRRQILSSFGNNIREAKKRTPVLFDAAHRVLEAAFLEAGKEPDRYLTDWEPKNIIVEHLRTPVAKQRYRLSVIDQYKS